MATSRSDNYDGTVTVTTWSDDCPRCQGKGYWECPSPGYGMWGGPCSCRSSVKVECVTPEAVALSLARCFDYGRTA